MKPPRRVRGHGVTGLRGRVAVPRDEERQERHDEDAEPVDEGSAYENPEGPGQEVQLRKQETWLEREKESAWESWEMSRNAKRAGSGEPARRRL
jgi:hypothetical protein